jgi:deoxyadenosine/deoxycytidine kinase
MLCGASKFNKPLNFDTSNVTDMGNMFEDAGKFNQPLNFDTSKVTTTSCMFWGAKKFNKTLNFDTRNVPRYFVAFCVGQMNNTMICIEGNIGSGKSTLMKALRLQLPETINGRTIVFMDEPVDAWSRICDANGKTMLELFYEDPKQHAFAFQMLAFISRQDDLKKAFERNPDAIFLSERSVFTDKEVFAKLNFDNGNISVPHYAIYKTWFDLLHVGYTPARTGLVFIETNSTECAARAASRARAGEDAIQKSYLQGCGAAHEAWMTSTKLPVIRLPGNKTGHNGLDAVTLDSIIKFIANCDKIST